MKKIVMVFLIAAVLLLRTAASAEVAWFSLAEGAEAAKTFKKPMVVDFFYGKGCPRCEFLQENVYNNPAIEKKLKDDFVPVRIDLTGKLTPEEIKLGERFEYKNDCLLLFLDPEGNLINLPGEKRLCFVDKVDPGWFVSYLDKIKAKYSGSAGKQP